MDQQSHSEIEVLEGRQLLSAAWGAQAKLIGQDLVASRFPQITGAGETVVVIDSGVDYNHPSLGGGFGKRVVAGWDYASNDSDPMSSSYAHGTGVAGMLAASPFDYGGYHYQGIAPGAKIIALREANTSQVAAALQWVIANKAKYNIVALNYTDFGGGNKTIAQSMKASLATLTAMNVYASTPSGNSGSTGGIADVGGVANVGSVNKGGGMSGFTNRGPGLDYLAPGEKVTLPYYDVGSKRSIYVDVADGTSFSAPQIAGAAALIRQVNPKFTNADINSILTTSAVQTYDSASKRSYPRLNLYGAITLAYQRIGKASPPPVQAPDPGQPAGVSVNTPTPIGTNTVLEAENFDSGNEGTAYHDAQSANLGGNSYRNGTGVDVITVNDQGSARAVGIVKAGEWLKYTTNVQAAGTYNIEFRVSALGAGGAFHLEVDGKNVTGTLGVPDTKNWNTYSSVTKTGISLSAGQHTMRLVFDKNGKTGYVGNFNLMRFVKSGSTPVTAPASAPATATAAFKNVNLTKGSYVGVNAEDFDNGANGVAYKDSTSANQGGQYRNTSVDLEKCADSRGGYDVGYMTQGEWLDYTVNVAKAGTFNVDFRIASAYTGGKFHLEVDGKNVTGSLSFTNTGNFQKWTTLRKGGVAIAAGKHTLKFVVESTGGHPFAGNLNWIQFS
jgi:hypothetical protein